MKRLFTLFTIIVSTVCYSQNCLPTSTLLDLKEIEFAEIKNCRFSLLTDKFDDKDKPIFVKAKIANRKSGIICSKPDFSNLQVSPSSVTVDRIEIKNTFKTKEFKSIDLIDSLQVELEGIGCANEMGICGECIQVFIRYEDGTEKYFGDDYFTTNLGFPVSNFQNIKEIEIADIECAFFTDWFIPDRLQIKFNPFLKPWGTIYNKDIFADKLDSLPQEGVLVTLLQTGETTYTDKEGNFYFCDSESSKEYTLKAEYNNYSVEHKIGPSNARCKTKNCKISIHEKLQEQIYHQLDDFNDKLVKFELCEVPDLSIDGYQKIILENELENNRNLVNNLISNVDKKINNTAKLYAGLQPYKPYLDGYNQLNDVKAKAINDAIEWAIGCLDLLKKTNTVIKRFKKEFPLLKIDFKYKKLIDNIFEHVEKFLDQIGVEDSTVASVMSALQNFIDTGKKQDLTAIIHWQTKNSVQGVYINNESNPLLNEMFRKIETSNSVNTADDVISQIQKNVLETNDKVYDSYNSSKDKLNYADIAGKVKSIGETASDVLKVIPQTELFAKIAKAISKTASFTEIGFLVAAFIEADNCQDEIIKVIKENSDIVASKKNPNNNLLNNTFIETVVNEYNALLDSVVGKLQDKKYVASNSYYEELLTAEEKLNYKMDSITNNYLGLIGKNNITDKIRKELNNLLFESSNLRMQVDLFYFALPFEEVEKVSIDSFQILCDKVKESNTKVLSEILNFKPVNNNIGYPAFLMVENKIDKDNPKISKVAFKVKNFGSKGLGEIMVKISGNEKLNISENFIKIMELESGKEVDFSFRYNTITEDTLEIISMKIFNGNKLEDLKILTLGFDTQDETTSVKNDLIQNTFKLYPNPTNMNFINLIADDKAKIDFIEIHNSNGEYMNKIELLQGNRNLYIDVKDYPQGFYYVNGWSNNKVVMKGTFIKTR